MWGYETEAEWVADQEDDEWEEGDGDVYYGNEAAEF
jgi:hypothetical protein